MDGWPSKDAVERATDVWLAADGLARDGASEVAVTADTLRRREQLVQEMLTAAGLPEIVGLRAAAKMLDVGSGNFEKVPGLPEPLFVTPSGRFWSVDAIRGLRRSLRARRCACGCGGRVMPGDPVPSLDRQGDPVADLTDWAEDRGLVVKTRSWSQLNVVAVQEQSARAPFIERPSSRSLEEAAEFVINALSRLGTGPRPWSREVMTHGN